MAASSETITVDITGCTYYDEDVGNFKILRYGDGHIKIKQIIDWVKSEAKFLRFTFKYNNQYGSVLFAKDAITQTNSLDYTSARTLYIESFISKINEQKFIFDLEIWPSTNDLSFIVYKVDTPQVGL